MAGLVRILLFAVAGGIGFLVDAGILTGLVWLGADPLAARLGSFAAAMTTTWLVNRSLAFRDRVGRPTWWEFARYIAASALAALINLGVYTLLILWGEPFRSRPVIAVAIATLVAMAVNFYSYASHVFAKPKT